MSTPLVTVLIDTYNYGEYVEEAIESALAQGIPREQREILVVDDGSTDDTAERLKKYGDSIRYIRKTNGGQASAFNLGFAEARGEIIATLDADDVWLPDKLQRVCEIFEKNPDAGMVYHRTYWWRAGEQATGDRYFVEVSGSVPENLVSLLRYPMIATSCLAFRRSALNLLLPVPETLRSQADAYLTALIIFVAPVAALPELLAKYRLHGANLFQAAEGEAGRDRIEHRMAMRAALSKEIRAWLEQHGYDLTSPDLQAYLKQWKKAQEKDGFELHTPSRWRYFLHLLEYPRIYRDIKSPRHRLYDYVRACGALILGYEHLHVMDDLRRTYKGVLDKLKRETAATEERKESLLTN
ncbi:MAG: glycosyltransferase [Candidatus Acidiferrum sp.]